MKFRKSNLSDVNEIISIIKQAQSYFKNQGIDQWQNGYPNEDTILTDINNRQSFVIEKNGEVLGTVMYSLDGESTYKSIHNGAWLTNDKYVVMHRIAVSNKHKGLGIAETMLNHIEEMTRNNNIHSIKIDTHKDNISMQRFLKKNGFEYCGEIFLNDGNLRIAFEKLI